MYLLRGVDKQAQGDEDGAKADIGQWVLLRGGLLVKIGDWDGAIACFTQAIALDPKNAEAYYERGVSWWEIKDRADYAESDLAKAIALNAAPFADHLYRAASWCVKKGFADGLAEADKAIALDPDDAQACFIRGIAKDGMGIWTVR